MEGSLRQTNKTSLRNHIHGKTGHLGQTESMFLGCGHPYMAQDMSPLEREPCCGPTPQGPVWGGYVERHGNTSGYAQRQPGIFPTGPVVKHCVFLSAHSTFPSALHQGWVRFGEKSVAERGSRKSSSLVVLLAPAEAPEPGPVFAPFFWFHLSIMVPSDPFHLGIAHCYCPSTYTPAFPGHSTTNSSHFLPRVQSVTTCSLFSGAPRPG